MNHTVVLTESEDGSTKIFGMGSSEYGQLGYGGTLTQWTPLEIKFGGNDKVTQVACGAFHTLFLTDEGKVYACGKGTKGQLGFGTKKKNATVPTLVPIGSEAFSLACGAQNSFVQVFK